MKPILIKVKSIQRDTAGEDTEVELISTGQYYERNNIKYIRYMETDLTGMEGVRTTIKISPRSVVLVRNGKTNMRHEYIIGRMMETVYQTPFGNVDLAIKTHEYSHTIEDGNGVLHLGYDISLDGEWQYYNQLIIEIREDT